VDPLLRILDEREGSRSEEATALGIRFLVVAAGTVSVARLGRA
jgi:hypothetical protein